MDCDYRFLCTSKKTIKPYVNKALTIDDQNQLYWKRYATINKQLDLFEEAEFGFRKAVEW
jgi:Tfp pilus assembly protein PilF